MEFRSPKELDYWLLWLLRGIAFLKHSKYCSWYCAFRFFCWAICNSLLFSFSGHPLTAIISYSTYYKLHQMNYPTLYLYHNYISFSSWGSSPHGSSIPLDDVLYYKSLLLPYFYLKSKLKVFIFTLDPLLVKVLNTITLLP